MNTIAEKDNSIYALLNEESKRTVDRFIMFLYETQEKEEDLNEETIEVLEECREGKNIVGPFDTVVDLMRSLHA